MASNYWFQGAQGIGELPLACVDDCSAPGAADAAVAYWCERLQFEGPSWLIRRHLRRYGCWTAGELCDHQANRQRLLWIWACNCREGQELLQLEG